MSKGIPSSTDWKWVKLGDACVVITGTTPPKSDPANYGTDIPFFKPPHLWDGLISETEEMLSKKGSKLSRMVPPNTVLVTCIGNLGRTGFVKKNAAFNQQINAILENNRIIGKYIFYQAQSPMFRKQLESLATGTTVSIVNKGNFETIEIPVPPIETQQAIVSKIEELFSELDKGIESLKLAQQQLKVYRQSVLKWAFEGRLTNEDVKEGELPVGWKMISIEEIAKVGTGATPLKSKSSYYGGTIPWVTSGALNDEYVREATDFVTERALKETNLSVYPKHTLLIALYGEGKTRGKCSELLIEACTNQAIAAITLNVTNQYLKPYLKYFLLKNYDDIRKKSSGGVQPNLNLGIIKQLKFPLTPKDEQAIVVSQIENKLSVADKMEESINQSLQQSEALRQSILKRAFEGNLVKRFH